ISNFHPPCTVSAAGIPGANAIATPSAAEMPEAMSSHFQPDAPLVCAGAPTSCASKGSQEPHTVDAPVMSASFSTELHPREIASVSAHFSTFMQLHTMAPAGQELTLPICHA